MEANDIPLSHGLRKCLHGVRRPNAMPDIGTDLGLSSVIGRRELEQREAEC